MRKRILFIIFLITIVTISASFTACTRTDNIITSYNDELLKSNYSIKYNDRVYYVSNELGEAGIYSMNLDGTDIKIEVKNPSVTDIELVNNKLYFIGLKEILNKAYNSAFEVKNKYTLYYHDIGSDSYSSSDLANTDNTIGFFISERGDCVISYGAMDEELSLFENPFIFTPRSSTKVKKKTITIPYNDINSLKDIYEFNDFIIFAENYTNDDYPFFAGNMWPYVIDKETGDSVFEYTASVYHQNSLKAFYMNGDNIYCSYNELVIVLDRNTYDIKTSFVPEGIIDNYNIDKMIKCNNKIYIIADQWGDKRYKAQPLIKEKLYKMDPDTFVCNEVLDLGSNQRIVGLHDDYIILLDNGNIYKTALNNGTLGNKEELIKAPSDIYTKNYSFDYAGDWMFLYKIYPQSGSIITGTDLPGQQLLYKINLQTGEVIKNDVKLDFSALDSYKEK